MSEVITQTFEGAAPVVLSGPTFAREVALGEPTALVAASSSLDRAKEIQTLLSTATFRVYTNDDVLGVELGGALKNVIALAVGVATGLGLGHNPKAALMTRGLAEISRLVEAMGGRRETLAGLAGMGDLVLTCTGHLSRNRQVGIELGKGRPLGEVLSGMEQVAEGVRTTHAAVALAREHGVDMPIATHMERLLRGETTPQDVMRELMTRPLKSE
jgi:glycerol-3-phosphate dehydrogenase (NAD(P)+)